MSNNIELDRLPEQNAAEQEAIWYWINHLLANAGEWLEGLMNSPHPATQKICVFQFLLGALLSGIPTAAQENTLAQNAAMIALWEQVWREARAKGEVPALELAPEADPKVYPDKSLYFNFDKEKA